MKKVFLFLFLILPSTLVFSQVYQEIFGQGGNLSQPFIPITSYLYYTISYGKPQLPSISYSGTGTLTGTVSNSILGYEESKGCYTGASGGGYVVLESSTNSNDKSIIIDGINTLNVVNAKLVVGTLTSLVQSNQLRLSYWNNNTLTWEPISMEQPVIYPNVQFWSLKSSGFLPSQSSLKIRLINHYTYTTAATKTRIFLDDLKITYTSLGLDENTRNNVISYPNPVTDVLNFNTDTEKHIKIYNTLGALLIEKYITNKIELTELPVGIYIYLIREGERTLNYKFIKK